MKLLLGEYLPDQPDGISDGLNTISNLYPGKGPTYRPVGAYQPLYSALPAVCKGAASFTSPQGRSAIIAGTTTNLYRAYSGGFASIGAGYSLSSDGRWRFAQFGGLAIATNGADAMQKIDLATSVVSALGGTPPKFKMLGVVQNFLVGGVLDGDTNTVGWSGENNAEYWSFGSKKSDYNIFPDGGDVKGIVSGEYGLILQRGCVRRMEYTGGNTIFRFDKIATNIGCVSEHSVAQYGDTAFWYADSGFQMWTGSQIVPIGFEKVDATFSKLYGVADWVNGSCAIDGPRCNVVWSLGGKQWLYNWQLQKWTIIDVPAEVVFSGVTKTISIDETDPVVGVPDNNLDYPGLVTLDSPRFKGGDPRFYLFSTDHSCGTLTGANLPASASAGNYELTDSQDTRVRRVRPITDAIDGIVVSMTVKQRLGDPGSVRVSGSLSTTGEIPLRARGRFVTMAVTVNSPVWSYLQGIDLPSGKVSTGARR